MRTALGIYIFNKSDFEKRNSSERVSYKKIKPVERIEVRWADFTGKVNIVKSNI